MKKTALFLVGVAMLVAIPGLAAVAAASDAASSEVTTLTGQYEWVNMDHPGPLEMVLTQTGAGTWAVACHFEFDGRERTYLGTAEGSISPAGVLKGNMRNENERRTWVFEGEFSRAGGFEGTHEETTPSRARRTGTMTLERASGS